jgi:hypothetical protein
MSEPALPELYDTLLDREALLQLTTDIETCGELLGVSLRRGARQHGDHAPVALRDAVMQVLDGSAAGLQLRYLHQGRQWWDTVLRTPDGFRLVRIDHGQTLNAP